MDKSESPATLTPDEAKNTMVFLNRCDLKGSEADVLAAIKFKLSLIIQGKPLPRPFNVTDLVGRSGSSSKE